MYLVISYLIEFFLNSILFSNLAIALQRFFVFFHSKRTDTFFNSPYIYIWLGLIWVLPILIIFLLFQNNCTYRYNSRDEKFKLHCYKIISEDRRYEMETPTQVQTVRYVHNKYRIFNFQIEDIVQVGIPILIVLLYIALVIRIMKMKRSSRNKMEVTILKQAFFIFIMFQIYNIVTLYGKTKRMNVATAFYLKRIINTTEILAGAVTPCFVFFTSREIRKLITAKVTAVSQGNSIPRNPRMSLRPS
ncbi:hypothetical protein CAEBREN_02131 [Caenorhabditis brenneri]|uniref:G-protein coupled receptors family 1 profile domain-containing protein n=1 Tax=Caenorhabditis brenneri TaxID=135651 RepID=G0N998_CAEBE|nr:hypothetical protein CAEBREN_02131 [Caenorhabditis brenneri]